MLECSYINALANLEYLIVSFVLLGVCDILIHKFSTVSSRWYKLHFISNLIVCITCYIDFWTVLVNPLDMYQITRWSLVPSNITLALHIYHILMFDDITMVDWVHHIVMMTLLLLTYFCPNLALTNYSLFMLSGFPGGIDYLLLILVREGYIKSITEKWLNSNLNIWVRSPFILIGGYIIYIQWRYNLVVYDTTLTFMVIAGLYWNAQYFTKRVVYNWGYKSSNLKNVY